MSSLGSQWRVIRHYLSLTNLNSEVEKLIQKVKPATPEQWENLLKRLEKAISVHMSSTTAIEKPQTENQQNIVNTSTIEETAEKAIVKEPKPQLKKEEKLSSDGLVVGSEAKDITLESLWQGLKLKKDLHFGNISQPSWKSSKPVVTKTSIHSRTAYVISALVAADSAESALRRTDSFIDHLKQYPEARDYAIKEGAVRALLRVQHRLSAGDGCELRGAVSEALALVGHCGPTRGPGPAILSLDGGGIRGLIAIDVLKQLERLTGRKVSEMFDYIIGVSTGAIIASVIGSGIGTLDTAQEMYTTLAKQMFGNTSLIGGASRLVWSQSYYDTAAWEALLRAHLRDCELSQCNRHHAPKMALVSCVMNSGARVSPFLFRTYECGFRTRPAFPGTARARVWHAVRASAAAPAYFNEFRLRGLLLQDGGVVCNNPAGVGLHEARLLFGADSIAQATVVSVGTGKPLQNQKDYTMLAPSEAASTSWREKFNKILDSATDTEGVHQMLNDLLPAESYFRFNPPLMAPCAMDEVDDRKLAALRADTEAYIRRNQHKFERAAARLTRPRPLHRRLQDALRRRALLLGLAD
ncbi:calcium-independent phospholipase A2-gamma-like [Plodia interpunctella]|uniref:calcium-independent phospholipase A2-gamma-like n=1 Tax=Plodia interpunctella TaxID=58824 RepID=UPI002367FB48|nr:calcium-independent phospholipase A2-gamma-like [Plodia interpunctella]XP_053620384.1 calcium-independent phospholipase A2-gamma-like [Plodia interpunctella]